MSLTVQTSSCCWFYTRGRGHRVRHVTWHRSANRITFDGCLSSPLFWNAGRHVASVNQCLIDVSLSALRLSHHVGSDPVLLFCCQLKKKKRSPLSGVSPWAQNNLRLWHGEQRQDEVWTLFSSHGSAVLDASCWSVILCAACQPVPLARLTAATAPTSTESSSLRQAADGLTGRCVCAVQADSGSVDPERNRHTEPEHVLFLTFSLTQIWSDTTQFWCSVQLLCVSSLLRFNLHL